MFFRNATVNQQVRGELAGQKANIDSESMHIKKAVDAPKFVFLFLEGMGE